ncbi:MAG: NFACT family protein [Clostridia bacterium]|nr:NFACT family protein [Clostridia bacterium]
MAFDASVIRCLAIELNQKLKGGKIDKIHQPQKDELYLVFRTFKESFRLRISVTPACPRLNLTSDKYENPPAPPMFCMLLRKHLGGGRLIQVEQIGFERILIFHIESYDELGDLSVKKLIVEIMGKHSNIILVNKEDKIIDSIKRIDISLSSVRQVLPGLTYHLPPNDRKNPLISPLEEDLSDKREPEKELTKIYSGISPQLAGEILRTGFDNVIEKIKNNEFSPCIILDSKDNAVDFSAIAVTQYGQEFKIVPDESISGVVDTFYRQKAHSALLKRLSAELLRLVSNNIERCEKKLSIFERQIQDSQKKDTYKIYGELITANLYKIKYGDKEVVADNYYDGTEVTIPLDENLSPAKNAQRYYTKYTKAKTAEEQAIIQKKKTEKELKYLESVADEIARADSPSDIAEIKEELRETGYISADTSKRKKKDLPLSPIEFEIDGYTVLVGRNNRQNDYLTLKMARSTDIWLHTKDIPGSHVIIRKKQDEEIPDAVIEKSAILAARHSKAKNSSKVAVDYTTVKNVKKPSGAKPGMVIYDHYYTIYVNPTE